MEPLTSSVINTFMSLSSLNHHNNTSKMAIHDGMEKLLHDAFNMQQAHMDLGFDNDELNNVLDDVEESLQGVIDE